MAGRASTGQRAGKGRAGPRSRTRRRRWYTAAVAAAGVAVALVVAAVLVGAGSGEDGHAPARGSAERTKGPAAADFTLQTLGGETFSLAEYRGGVVVVEFLAPGCPSCAADLAGLSEAAEQRPNITLLVADVSGAGAGELRAFYRDRYDVPREVMIAPDSEFTVSRAYGASALGDTVVITPAGDVSWKGRWAGDVNKLLARIDQAAGS